MPSPKQVNKDDVTQTENHPEAFTMTNKTIATIVPDSKTAPRIYDSKEAEDFIVNRGGVPVSIYLQGRFRTLNPGQKIRRSK